MDNKLIQNIIDQTDWETLFLLRNIYMKYKYPSTPIIPFNRFKSVGIGLLNNLKTNLTNKKEYYCSSACLKAYKENAGYGTDNEFYIGIRFEADEHNEYYNISEVESQ